MYCRVAIKLWMVARPYCILLDHQLLLDHLLGIDGLSRPVGSRADARGEPDGDDGESMLLSHDLRWSGVNLVSFQNTGVSHPSTLVLCC